MERKLADIFLELTSLLKNRELTKEVANKEIRKLYREYLKLYVKLNRMIPEFDDGKFKGNVNCYFYALDLPLPFCTNLGEISGLEFFDYKFSNPTSSDLLDYVYTDLDTLNIKAYDSAINMSPKNNGYKIVIFMEVNKDYDYHFVRQNIDGSWSSKLGYKKCVVKMYNPLDYLNDNINHDRTSYEYIKTLELVKPSIKR